MSLLWPGESYREAGCKGGRGGWVNEHEGREGGEMGEGQVECRGIYIR